MMGRRLNWHFIAVAGLVMSLLSGCLKHPDGSTFPLVKIRQDAVVLMETYYPNQAIELTKYPKSFVKLQPAAVYVEPKGVYIKLDESWFKESGLFIPREDFDVSDVPDDDTVEYLELGDQVYSYLLDI